MVALSLTVFEFLSMWVLRIVKKVWNSSLESGQKIKISSKNLKYVCGCCWHIERAPFAIKMSAYSGAIFFAHSHPPNLKEPFLVEVQLSAVVSSGPGLWIHPC